MFVFCGAVEDIEARLLELWKEDGVAGAVCAAATWTEGYCCVACRRFDLVSIPRGCKGYDVALRSCGSECCLVSLTVEAWLKVLFLCTEDKMQGDDAAISAGSCSLSLISLSGSFKCTSVAVE